MSARFWSGATIAKLTFGVALATVIAPLIDVLSRKWPTGGAK